MRAAEGDRDEAPRRIRKLNCHTGKPFVSNTEKNLSEGMSFMKLTGKEKKELPREEASGFALDDEALEDVAGGAMNVPSRKGENEDSCAQNPKPWLRPPVR